MLILTKVPNELSTALSCVLEISSKYTQCAPTGTRLRWVLKEAGRGAQSHRVVCPHAILGYSCIPSAPSQESLAWSVVRTVWWNGLWAAK